MITNIINNMQFISIFEQKISKYTCFKHAVSTDCCTNAIILSLAAKIYLNEFNKSNILNITKYTYMSIPMTLINYGYKIKFINDKWNKFYEIGNTNIFDAATDMHENMVNDYNDDALVCISFQQKKRLSLGRGGAILFNNAKYLELLRRLRYDGRNPYISDKVEIENTGSQFYTEKHIGMYKVEALQEQVAKQTGVKIDIVKSKYRSTNIKGYDIIVLALDNLETRKAIVEDCED